jgi:hypothetical protein
MFLTDFQRREKWQKKENQIKSLKLKLAEAAQPKPKPGAVRESRRERFPPFPYYRVCPLPFRF